VMPNVFSPLLPVHEQYDLKGSTVARRVLEKNRRPLDIDPSVALKDLDLNEKLHLGPIRKVRLWCVCVCVCVLVCVCMNVHIYI
jgi:Phosphatidylinositol-4-phosphate 5-Kinase